MSPPLKKATWIVLATLAIAPVAGGGAGAGAGAGVDLNAFAAADGERAMPQDQQKDQQHPTRGPQQPKRVQRKPTRDQKKDDRVHNPLFDAADPHAMIFGSRAWIYPTGGSAGRENFFAWYSDDLVKWTRVGPILDFADVKWMRDDGKDRHGPWAPCIIERRGRYYFYYSAGPQDPVSRIGVAVGRRPQGPFRDSGKVLLAGGDGFEAIDPMVFHDPASGKYYFYAGGSAGAKLRVFELNDDLFSFKKEENVDTPPEFTEGVFMHFANDRYYLTYSHGWWKGDSYSVHYATGKSPLGPWEYHGAILTSDDTHKGPGHHSIIHNERSDKWYIVYHRWNDRQGKGPYDGGRSVAIDELTYDKDGLINPIHMTDSDGPPADDIGPKRRTR